MRIDHSVDVPAPIELVWQVYTRVEQWPQWMESMDHVDVMDGRPLAQGSKVWIAQPRLPAATWTVTELTPGRGWAWVSRSRGVTSTATHELSVVDRATTRVDLSVEFSGVLGSLMARLLAGRTRSYMVMEARGLAEACEFHASR